MELAVTRARRLCRVHPLDKAASAEFCRPGLPDLCHRLSVGALQRRQPVRSAILFRGLPDPGPDARLGAGAAAEGHSKAAAGGGHLVPAPRAWRAFTRLARVHLLLVPY